MTRRRSTKNVKKKSSHRGTMALRRSSRRRTNRTQTSAEPRDDRRNPATYRAVLAAATGLVGRRGYNRVTIEAIAARARAGKQTIYRWWESKAALFLEVYESLVPEAEFLAGAGKGAERDLRRYLRLLIRGYTAAPARAILAGLIAEAQVDRKLAKALTTHLIRRHRKFLRRLLQHSRNRGALRRAADLDLVADTIASAIWMRLLLRHGPLDTRFADKLVAYTLKGLPAAAGRRGA